MSRSVTPPSHAAHFPGSRPLTRPAVSAHQGGAERGRPATREAYEDALDSGAEYVESDVRRTADGVLVVHHGARVRSTGPPLSTLTTPSCASGRGTPCPSPTRSWRWSPGSSWGTWTWRRPGTSGS
ncbi:glycerophosphodiester phosphodiesterase family protein [Streptomyces bullii]|uniref:Glycerophosphodiester phosphodiesterase family protein n=1 Tax=Streptomyces bullii TaxID=349910 RepID=A0ABW0UQE6_9ACTN